MRKTAEERFWEKVVKQDDGCWIWTAARIKGGYGGFMLKRRHWLAHRLAYTWLVGPIPAGHTLDHICRQPACVNPAHLQPVSLQENIEREWMGLRAGAMLPPTLPQIKNRYRNRPVWDRFWEKVDRRGDDDCWHWTGGKNNSGYGAFCFARKRYGAHRFVYEQTVGDIPAGYTIDHICRNRACVNPKHLRLLTHRENTLAGTGPSARAAMATHCPRGHEYTEDNIYWSQGNRKCRICKIEQERTKRARFRAEHPLQPQTHCRQGHEFIPENTRIAKNGQRRCRTCERRWVQEWQARQKESE